ncbi:GntR family transcriptional regulator [Allohahella marinimesophila]|uniref:GntR family transcriptional regulator n=1 Tax=Allohahella marinimesophila TaxID=1054972 RepID=A0ABP7PFC0_9GAMM
MPSLKKENMSHQPLYLQIRDALKKQILNGEYAPYERLPSEAKLMAAFEVSRITVRQALRDLHAEGLVFSSQGKGTFASKPKAMQDVKHLEGFAEAMTAKGYEASARLISIRETRPSKDVETQLEIGPKEDVVEVVRVRYLNREPVSVDTSWFPMAVGKKLFSRNLAGDIFPLLENLLQVRLGRADVSLEARPADADIAKLLEMEPGSPIMWVQRLTRDANDRPIDYEYLAVRGDSYKYRFQIQRATMPQQTDAQAHKQEDEQ